MFKVGDKVKRSPANLTKFWNNCCIDMRLCPDGIFTVSHIKDANDIRFQEMGELSFETNKFELASNCAQNKINVGDVYQTRDGQSSVRIICIDAQTSNQYPVIGLARSGNMLSEFIETYTPSGAYRSDNTPLDKDLVLPWVQQDWSKVKVDTLIEISVDSGKLYRYFHAFDDGDIIVYTSGATSRTYTTLSTYCANICKVVEE